MLTILTIGHSNHPPGRFLELLTQHNVGVLADIRRYPSSRQHPHYNRDSLNAALAAQGVEYAWIEALGGRRKPAIGARSPNGGLRNESFRNYADYMLTDEFLAGVTRLLALAKRRPTVMMCAEGLWWQCHRRLVSDWLVANGASVAHIFPNGVTKPHELTPEARVRAGRVTYPAERSLFDAPEQSE